MDLRGITGWLQTTLDLFGPGDAPAPVAVPRRRSPRKPPASAPLADPALPLPGFLVHDFPRQAEVPGQPLSQAIAPASFRHPGANREARLGDAVVTYVFARAKRRTIGFLVGPDGLEVRAPRWTPMYEVDAALQEKSAWILRKLGETRVRLERQESARIDWRDGAELPYLGGRITLALDPSHAFVAAGSQLDALPEGEAHEGARRVLRIGLSHAATPAQIRDAVQAWLMRQAQSLFQERLNYYAPLLQVQWRRLSLSSAGTRWGSASSDGAIRLNWRLVHFRLEVIDYVVAHELSHLRVMDHSPRFWETVRSVVPDHLALRAQLRDDAIPRW